MTNTLPTKGTVWIHAVRKDWEGNPLKLTVTSITKGKVYSVTDLRTRVKTPVDLFDKLCKEIVSVPEPKPAKRGPTFTVAKCETLFQKAHTAGQQAGEGASPTPMFVVQRANPLDDNSPIVRRYPPVMDGVCGFASVIVRPGNSTFANYLRRHHGASRHYYGGISYWVSGFGQSYERKVAYAQAFVSVLTDAGIDASVSSRLD